MPSLAEKPPVLQHWRYRGPVFHVEGDLLEALTAQEIAENAHHNLGF